MVAVTPSTVWVRAAITRSTGATPVTLSVARDGTLALAGKLLSDNKLDLFGLHYTEPSTTAALSALRATVILPSTVGLAALSSSIT